MSLLQTNNRKFNTPFVFIAGALFLVVLTFFAYYLESRFKETKSTENIVLPVDETAIIVRIDEKENIFIFDEKVAIENVATLLQSKLDTIESPTIQLLTLNISSVTALKIMEIAQSNHFTVVLEASSK